MRRTREQEERERRQREYEESQRRQRDVEDRRIRELEAQHRQKEALVSLLVIHSQSLVFNEFTQSVHLSVSELIRQ